MSKKSQASAFSEACLPGESHLLVVDDDRLILYTLASGLRDAGYQVSTAESAQEAQNFLTIGEAPDLAILDVQMPQVDGLMLAERLRDFEHVPFVILSAYSDTASVDRATQLGALSYMVKPIDVPQMVPNIEAALQRAKDMSHLHSTSAKLKEALGVERVINVAVGITMVQYQLSRAAAFDTLRGAARSQRRKMSDIAQTVIQAHEMVFPGNAQG